MQSGKCVIGIGKHNIHWAITALNDMYTGYLQRIQWHQIHVLAST